MASFSVGSITSSSFRISVTINPAYTHWRVFVRYSSDPSSSVYDSLYTERTGNFATTVSGLTPNTEYVINVGYTNDPDGGGTWLGAQTVTTSSGTSISPWSWSSSNGSATSAQTQAAYAAVTTKGYLSDFSYLVWNDLCDKVMAAINGAGQSWLTVGGVGGTATPTYADTKMSSSDKELTAGRFNAVRYNVGVRKSTGIQPVSRGDKVLGSYFVTLASSLNSWISDINS